MLSLIPTNSASVLDFVLIFCVLLFEQIGPFPMPTVNPVCDFKSSCTPYEASTYEIIETFFDASRFMPRSGVLRTY